MPLFALFERALSMDARRRTGYVLRALLLAGTLLMVFTGQFRSMFTGAPGLTLFASLVGLNLLFIIMAGVPVFVTCIAEEKEEQTLGLLRMTNLSIAAILFGKSTSRLVTLLVIMAAQIPFLLLAVTLGGVSISQVAAAMVALFGLLVLIANVTLFWSVVCRRSSVAVVLSFISLWALAVVPGALNVAVNLAVSNPEPDTLLAFLASLSPFDHLTAVMSAGYGGGLFSKSFFACLVLAAISFGMAWILFDFCTRKPVDAAPSRAATRSHGRFAIFAPGRAWGRPVLWKDFYFHMGGKLVMGFRAIVVIGLLVASHIEVKTLSPMVAILGLWIMLEVAFLGAGFFAHEISQRTLPTLFSLPGSFRRTVWEKVQARLLVTLPVLVGWGVAVASEGGMDWRAFILCVLVLALLGYVSCWLSFRNRLAAPFLAMILVWIGSLLTLGVVSLLAMPWSLGTRAEWSEIFTYVAFLLALMGWLTFAHASIRQRLLVAARS